jgi:hypothetical protein
MPNLIPLVNSRMLLVLNVNEQEPERKNRINQRYQILKHNEYETMR